MIYSNFSHDEVMIYSSIQHKFESSRAKSDEIYMDLDRSKGLCLRYVDLYDKCETLSEQILETPAGTRKFTGCTSQILAFPPGMETLDLDAKLVFFERKKTKLEKLLVKMQEEHASVAVPVAPVLDMLHAAGTSSVLHAPPHNAAQASAAPNAAAAQ
jgi:hypothetical protein